MRPESGSGDGAFNPRTMLLVTAIGSLAFIAVLVLGAYAPDLRSGHNGGSHALSNAATGFGGLVQLAEATGRKPVIIRAVADLKNEDLAVDHPGQIQAPISARSSTRAARGRRWSSCRSGRRFPSRNHPGWVRVARLAFPGDPEQVLAPGLELRIARSKGHGEPLRNLGPAVPKDLQFLAPAVVQSMTGRGLKPLITTPAGEIVLGQVGARNLYVLSDPDLINNHGMGDQRQARSALALLDYLNRPIRNRCCST